MSLVQMEIQDTNKAREIYNFQKPRWEKTLAGFAKMLPQIFSGFFTVGPVTVNPNWVQADIGDEKVEWPPMGNGRFAEVILEINYLEQRHHQLGYLHDLLEGTMKSPMLYNRGWASHTIYDDKAPRALIRMQIFDTLDSQLALFADWDSIDVLVKELQDKMTSHIRGMEMLEMITKAKQHQYATGKITNYDSMVRGFVSGWDAAPEN